MVTGSLGAGRWVAEIEQARPLCRVCRYSRLSRLSSAVAFEPMGPGDDAFDLDLAAASLRAGSSDVPMMLKLLVSRLGDVLGNRLVVERAGGRFHKSNEIKSVQVSMGDDDLRADIEGPTVRCTVGHS